jgi:molybdopterin/thiamine biosynthesis adenylyltransferase
MKNFEGILSDSKSVHSIYTPIILRLNKSEDADSFQSLFEDKKVDFIYDEINAQLKELIKGFHPAIRLKNEDYPELIKAHLAGAHVKEYGVWVYYPWSRRLVHLLDEKEFIEVRTNRNQYKITRQERDLLSEKRVGIIGLSVGQSIALTLSMERGYGELRLADFDELELSNLNRIRTGVHNLSVPKAVITAREIAEIDPFLRVKCFLDGLTEENMDDFFLEGGKLDMLIDECDGLDMKILCRYKARELQIPVLMDTSDRGMLDVERFDLEPNRPVLHGTVEGVDLKGIKDLTNEQKVPIIFRMLGIENVSLKIKASMLEVNQSINTWPQLASSVALGGAVGADVCRRILLDEFHDSGRYYVDLEEIIADKSPALANLSPNASVTQPLSADNMRLIAKSYVNNVNYIPDTEVIRELVEAARLAPSAANNQPWKWLYKGGLFLFYDEHRSNIFTDYQHTTSFSSLGSAFENLYVQAHKRGLKASYQFQPLGANASVAAVIHFESISGEKDPGILDLSKGFFNHPTPQNDSLVAINQELLEEISQSVESIRGARFHVFNDPQSLKTISKINGASERIRLLNPMGHKDFMQREVRWTEEEAERTQDGVPLSALGLSNSQLGALTMIKDEKLIATLNKFGGGRALDSLGSTVVENAAAVCLITIPDHGLESFFEGGRAIGRFFLAASNRNLTVQPIMSPLHLFSRLIKGKGEGLDKQSLKELYELRSEFEKITSLDGDDAEVFLAVIAPAKTQTRKTFRLPVDKILVIE